MQRNPVFVIPSDEEMEVEENQVEQEETAFDDDTPTNPMMIDSKGG